MSSQKTIASYSHTHTKKTSAVGLDLSLNVNACQTLGPHGGARTLDRINQKSLFYSPLLWVIERQYLLQSPLVVLVVVTS